MPESSVLGCLSNEHVSVVVLSDGGMPEIGYWGSPIGDGTIDAGLFARPVVGGGLDVDAPLGVVAEAARGWFGRPGIEGNRPGGGDFAPRFSLIDAECDASHISARLRDEHAHLELTLDLALAERGLVSVRSSLRNTGDDEFRLGALRVALPMPDRAVELLTLGGRHLFEFAEQRVPWIRSCVTVENRHGKTSHERLGAVVAGTERFGEHHGEVWGCHIGWSGNYELVCDSVSDGHKVIQVGELLLPGEVVLQPGETYSTPTVYGAHSARGLNEMSKSFHDFLRSRSSHPRLPRPVHLNTWEAVYFDHDADKLRELADVAASVGVERFVLDDGWFGGRRQDDRGLGDWTVSDEAWPDGLGPLIDHVRELGMEFGIWVEPEMVNPASDLARAHPEWMLVDDRYPHVLGRNQLVLDVGRSEVRDHLFERLDLLLAEHDIAYVKWDHNRDLVSPAAGDLGRGAGVHRQTVGFYELLDRLRAAHPGVEFETCASGGGRVDFGVLERAERVWTSDSIDPHDRHSIQRGFSMLFPPELMGSHVGSPVSHATLRHHRLGFRGAAALFGAFGVEWNLLEASADEREHLARLIALHTRFRSLLHTGDVLRCDHPDRSVVVQGVIAGDRSEALVAVTRLASAPSHHTAAVRIPHLDDDTDYDVLVLQDLDEPVDLARRQPDWVDGKLVATGRQLATIGLRSPQLFPDSSILLHLEARRAP